jgi:hypothetical protein
MRKMGLRETGMRKAGRGRWDEEWNEEDEIRKMG